MTRYFYAREGAVIFQFRSRRSRDAWVATARRSEPRLAIAAGDIRHVDGIEVRVGPELEI